MGLPIFVGCAAWTFPAGGVSREYRERGGTRGRRRRRRVPRIPNLRRPHGAGRREEPHEPSLLLPAQADLTLGRSSSGRGRPSAPGQASDWQPFVRRDPEHEGRLRHRPGAGRPSGQLRASSGERGGRAEPGRLLSTARRAAEPRDPHEAGDAGVQVSILGRPHMSQIDPVWPASSIPRGWRPPPPRSGIRVGQRADLDHRRGRPRGPKNRRGRRGSPCATDVGHVGGDLDTFWSVPGVLKASPPT